ncbi:WD repeat-containing protein 88 [Frankliniella fusca]|uniref:WD repeat-containing protein 88 n=1 Tax=Frankliniella fusca TaxID=407009 RepID=A0AAE1LJX8_9NEOP|nr:WD repeat-containing protein 88 [Frankliniella fusca]
MHFPNPNVCPPVSDIRRRSLPPPKGQEKQHCKKSRSYNGLGREEEYLFSFEFNGLGREEDYLFSFEFNGLGIEEGYLFSFELNGLGREEEYLFSFELYDA